VLPALLDDLDIREAQAAGVHASEDLVRVWLRDRDLDGVAVLAHVFETGAVKGPGEHGRRKVGKGHV
jgi:hypothetical protein